MICILLAGCALYAALDWSPIASTHSRMLSTIVPTATVLLAKAASARS